VLWRTGRRFRKDGGYPKDCFQLRQISREEYHGPRGANSQGKAAEAQSRRRLENRQRFRRQKPKRTELTPYDLGIGRSLYPSCFKSRLSCFNSRRLILKMLISACWWLIALCRLSIRAAKSISLLFMVDWQRAAISSQSLAGFPSARLLTFSPARGGNPPSLSPRARKPAKAPKGKAEPELIGLLVR
jgi:hypothetical protein